ncbi:MAG: hydantoinase/oxoprolinase family protein, partial [Gammaproteobacteria bacterium]
ENMCGAIRRIAAGHGFDPARYALVAMGGAGPLHAAELAALLGMRAVVVPPQPGLAAAWGLMVAPETCDFAAPGGATWPGGDAVALVAALDALAARAHAWLAAAGMPAAACTVRRQLDLRYAGMTHASTVDWVAQATPAASVAATLARFHAEFAQATGRSWRDREAVEVVGLRASGAGRRAPPPSPRRVVTRGACTPVATRAVTFVGAADARAARVYGRDALAEGALIAGPAVIEQYEATCLVPPGWQARVDARHNLVLTPHDRAQRD